MVNSHNFMIFENLSLCLAKDLCEKFPKSKIWDVHFLHFSMLIVIIYIFVCHMQPYLVQNWHRKWAVLKISHYIWQKSLWWSFQNQKSEMYIFFIFPCRSSWDMSFLLHPTVYDGKMAEKVLNFHMFIFFENLSLHFA